VNDILRALLADQREKRAGFLDMALDDRKRIRSRLDQLDADIDRMAQEINAISEALGEPTRDVPA
jgi:hypothetical protein